MHQSSTAAPDRIAGELNKVSQSQQRSDKRLPWQEVQWRRVCSLITTGRLPHALLLAGMRDIGKQFFALELASRLLCKSPTGESSCGSCTSCHLLKVGTHPDLLLVQPEESRLIKVDQIRELNDWANQTAQQGGAKVAVISPAEQMNVQSANALLKCLEEPRDGTYLMLVSHQPARLLPTLRSRCQKIAFAVPPGGMALSWLENQLPSTDNIGLLLNLAAGAPFRVLNHFDADYLERRSGIISGVRSIIEKSKTSSAVAGQLLAKEFPAEVYDVLYSILADAVKVSATGEPKHILNNDIGDLVDLITKHVSQADLLQMIAAVVEGQSRISGVSNPNPLFLLESLLVKFDHLATLRLTGGRK